MSHLDCLVFRDSQPMRSSRSLCQNLPAPVSTPIDLHSGERMNFAKLAMESIFMVNTVKRGIGIQMMMNYRILMLLPELVGGVAIGNSNVNVYYLIFN
jgi:hypothetical protein